MLLFVWLEVGQEEMLHQTVCVCIFVRAQGVTTPIRTVLASTTAVKMAVNGQTEILVPVNGLN